MDLTSLEQRIWDVWIDGLPTRREQKAVERERKRAMGRTQNADGKRYAEHLSAAFLAVTDPADDARGAIRAQFSDKELLALSAAEVRDGELVYSS